MEKSMKRTIFFNWDSLHARLNSHYQGWSYKKKKYKKVKGYRKSPLKEHTLNRCLLTLRLKAIQIIGQIKAFYRQKIPGSSCTRKETIDINVHVTSRNGDRKISQNNEQTSLKNKEVKLVEPVQKKIYQSNTYRKDVSQLHFDNEPRAHERQQVKDQQCCIFGFVVYPTIPI